MDTGKTLDIGAVIAEAFSLLRRKLHILAALFACTVIAPSFAALLLFAVFLGNAQVTEHAIFAFGVTGGVFVTLIVLNSFCQATIIHIALAEKLTGDSTMRNALANSLRKFFRIMGMAMLTGIAMLVTAPLFLLPAFFLATIWSISLPMLVHEDGKITAMLSQSRSATKGSRWKIFSVVLLMLATYWPLSYLADLTGMILPYIASVLVNAFLAMI